MTPAATEESEVALRVSLPDAQKILNALSEKPYCEVSVLLSALMGQIQEQLKSKPVAPQPTPVKKEG